MYLTKVAKTSINSRKAGRYFQVTGADCKALTNASKTADLFNKKGKTAKFIAGATAGGVAEGAFVGDVEEVGASTPDERLSSAVKSWLAIGKESYPGSKKPSNVTRKNGD